MTSRAILNRSKPQGYAVVCWTALVCLSIIPATAEPYDRMVGCWNGKGDTYDLNGVLVSTTTSRGGVSWKVPHRKMHFWQEITGTGTFKSEDVKAAVTQLHQLEFDLDVDGKSATFRSNALDVTGAETRPDVYIFVLNFKSGAVGAWYNNHFFVRRNIRTVLGPFVPTGTPGQALYVAAQTLTRAPCASKADQR
jgi:hypothetical protein